MSSRSRSSRLDLDTVFKGFDVVAILIAIALSFAVIALTGPFGEYVSTSPVAIASVLFGALLVATGYAAYALRRR